jgi:DNA-directed RNA polymerase subunit M/transcription elongation factor TFIIS
MIFKEKDPKFQCFDCKKVFNASEWNRKTNEVYENNQASLPRDYIKNNHTVDTVGTVESNPNLPAFVCPNCESAPMADELIYVAEN